MRRILYIIPLIGFICLMGQSCKYAPSNKMGDTVAAKDFEPIDTNVIKKQAQQQQIVAKDCTNIFIIGDGSTRELLQLISFPSRRDTMSFAKKRPVKVTGSADYGRIVRIGFVIGRDSVRLVKTVDEIKSDTILTSETGLSQ